MRPLQRASQLSWILIFFAAAGVQEFAWGSDTLSTPFTLNLTTASTQTLLSGLNGFTAPGGAIHVNLPDQKISNPFEVSISGIHVSLNYAFQTPEPVGGVNAWKIQSKSIGADVIVDSIDATQTVVETVGGVTFTVRVNATCSAIHLTLPDGAAQVQATVDLELEHGRVSTKLTDFSANWTPGSWKIVSMSCQAPPGFQELVTQTAQAQLQTINPFLPQIQQQIQAELGSMTSNSATWTMKATDGSGVSLTLSPETLHVSPAGEASLDGIAQFEFSRLQNTACATLIQAAAPAPASAGTDSLVMPISAVEGLIRCGYLNGSLSYSWSSREFPAFQSLLDNWLFSLFVWPDLHRFDSSSIFSFELFPMAEPAISGIKGDSAGDIRFSLGTPFKVAVYAPENDGPEHYLDFDGRISGNATLSLKNGVLNFREKVSSLNVAPMWDAVYASKYDPNEHLWSSIISRDIKGFLSNPGLSYRLPSWNAPGAFDLSVGNATPDGTYVAVSLDIQASSK